MTARYRSGPASDFARNYDTKDIFVLSPSFEVLFDEGLPDSVSVPLRLDMMDQYFKGKWCGEWRGWRMMRFSFSIYPKYPRQGGLLVFYVSRKPDPPSMLEARRHVLKRLDENHTYCEMQWEVGHDEGKRTYVSFSEDDNSGIFSTSTGINNSYYLHVVRESLMDFSDSYGGCVIHLGAMVQLIQNKPGSVPLHVLERFNKEKADKLKYMQVSPDPQRKEEQERVDLTPPDSV